LDGGEEGNVLSGTFRTASGNGRRTRKRRRKRRRRRGKKSTSWIKGRKKKVEQNKKEGFKNDIS